MGTRAPVLQSALDAFFASYFRRHPVSATFAGIHEHDDRLPDYSARGVEDAVGEIDALAHRFRSLPPEPLTEVEAIDRTLAESALDIERWEYQSIHFPRGNPCAYTGEAVFGVIALLLRPFGSVRRRLESAQARMRAIPQLLAQGQDNVRWAPPAWTELAIRECTGARLFLREGIEVFLREHGVADERVQAAASQAKQAFGRFQAHLEGDLRTRTTDEYACGEETLDLIVRTGHCLPMDAAALDTLGEEQLIGYERSLEAHARDLGARDWRTALAHLADRHPAPDRYYARYAELWEASRVAAEAHGLLTWPDAPVRYVPQPVWARSAAPYLYFLPYRSPAPYDRLPTTDYLVLPVEPDMDPLEQARRMRVANDSVIKLNHVVHHGGIGHHVQNWYASRAPSRVGRVAAVDCARRIAMICGGTMAEGWACYATDLMEEIGFFTLPEQCAHAHGGLRRAARAIVDVRLHRRAMTLEQAAAFYEERVGMAPEAAHAEAVKNSMFPGTALMYLAGTNLLHRLRRDLAARRTGPLDLRAFHDRVLSFGSIPVALVSRAMQGEMARTIEADTRRAMGAARGLKGGEGKHDGRTRP
jgi:Bacterial protein of unknown function (DUF885)